MKKLFIIAFLIFSVSCFAQDTKGTIKVKKVDTLQLNQIVEPVVMYVDQMPALPNMLQFIQANIKYPEAEKKAGIQGTVYVGFIVEVDGSLSNVRILQGIVDGSGCDNEALRIVKMMPKWTPGINKGQAVAVQCNLPIRFTL